MSKHGQTIGIELRGEQYQRLSFDVSLSVTVSMRALLHSHTHKLLMFTHIYPCLPMFTHFASIPIRFYNTEDGTI